MGTLVTDDNIGLPNRNSLDSSPEQPQQELDAGALFVLKSKGKKTFWVHEK